jgi:hypothetical protein
MSAENVLLDKIKKPSLLERFGLYYLDFFRKLDSTHDVFDQTDEQLSKKVNRIMIKGILLSCLVGLVCVFPTVWVDVHFAEKSFIIHYGWVAAVTIISILVEIYMLFLISLKASYEVSDIINLHASEKDLIADGLFSVKHILARTALELPDPEMKILGVDPFKRISKKNLFILSLIYKAKIFVSNVVLKYVLLYFVGKTIFGISILYEALLVECFWNGVVLRRVVLEARLRLFGFALANQIGKNVIKENSLAQLSEKAKIGCLRAVGNAVVMTQNYHPNMIILFLRFQQILNINTADKYDDWDLFLETLKKVTKQERNFLLDVFTVSAAFDGKLSQLESDNLQHAYAEEYKIYQPRLKRLTNFLKQGKLNAALAECKLDFIAG